MSTPSNSYAEKVYSEHPIALWALDDKADYISLISELQRDMFSSWSITNGTFFESDSDPLDPFNTSIKSLIKANIPEDFDIYTTLISPDIYQFSDLNQDLDTFAISTYFYSDSIYSQEIQIGYQYTDPDTLEIVENLRTFPISIFQNWSFVSSTFDIVNNIDAPFRIIIKLKFYPGAGIEDDYKVFFNGITVGQWSEEFNSYSLGINTTSLPSSIALDSSEVIEASEYQGNNNGYYFVNNNYLLAKNAGIPLVFGASNITKIYDNNNSPCLIIPGQGFLNESGKYNDYTVEFWMKIQNNSADPVRIFGPITSTDGLYVESGFLTLVINDNFQSYFVGEWNRPMLVHIRIIKDSASLLINGEEVISFNFQTKNLILPSILNELGKTQDWLGFYGNNSFDIFEIDCVSIYSYNVPITVAKRRWVYGQAVLSPEKIESSYNGTSTFIDYTFADYTANFSYPDFGKWEQGTFDNLVTTQTTIETPSYSLPEFFTGTKTLTELYSDCKQIQEPENYFFTFKPNEDWNESTYIHFPKFNIINDEVHSIYSVIQIDEDYPEEQTILKLYNSLNSNYFKIQQSGNEIQYTLYYNGIEEQISNIINFTVGEPIAIGFNISKLTNYFGGNISSFFGNRNGLKMYFAGDPATNQKFIGKIYSLGICSSFNTSIIIDHFNDNGTIDIITSENLLQHTASYTLIPEIEYDRFYLDIGTYGYWQDYLPLSYFGQYVKNDVGNEFYDLDFLQLNVNYPATTKTINNNSNIVLNTLDSTVRTYFTMQYITNGANLLDSNFTTVLMTDETKVIDVSSYTDWQNTKFEFVNGTIVYPPINVDFNDLAIVYTMEFKNRGTLNKPTKIKRLELASQVFNDNSFNPVGTRFGTKLYPYKKSGIYYDYKTQNPYSIYKGNTPYLYLTDNSGIELKKHETNNQERGIAIPINESQSSSYKVAAVQMWTMYNHKEFPETPEELFKIQYKNDTVIVYLVANSASKNRAKIYAKRLSDGLSVNGLAFYLNGQITIEPVISIQEWNVLGLSFANSLNFGSYIGKLTINGYSIFNNISTYQSTSLKEIQSKNTRSWFNVKTAGTLDLDWQYWNNSYTWEGVLVISSTSGAAVDVSGVYKTYIGTNKIIIDDNEGMLLNPDTVRAYTQMEWSPVVQTPV